MIGRNIERHYCKCGKAKVTGSGAAPSARWPGEAEAERFAFELRNETPAQHAFWMAYELADSIEAYIQNFAYGAPVLGEYPNQDVNPVWVNGVIDINKALTWIGQHLKTAELAGLDLGEPLSKAPGNRMRQHMATLLANAEHARNFADTLLQGIQNSRAGMIERAQQIARAEGADYALTSGGFLEVPKTLWRKITNSAQSLSENTGQAVVEGAKIVGKAAGEAVAQGVEASMPWGPIIAIGGVAVGLLWLTR